MEVVALVIAACAGCGLASAPANSPKARSRHSMNEGGGRLDVPEQSFRSPTPIETENSAEGTDDWIVTSPAAGQVEGYASTTSAAPGERVQVFVNTDKAREVSWALYRMGYYDKHGARLVARGDAGMVSPQAACPVDSATGMIECHWQPTFEIAISPNYWTGQYLIKLTADDGHASYVPLVIREPRPRAPLLVQASVNTWQAYNGWGKASLYGSKLSASRFAGPRAYTVSFDRPYACSAPFATSVEEVNAQPCDIADSQCTERPTSSAGKCVMGAGDFFRAERWMIAWLERQGYDVAYVTNVDIDAHPDLLDGRKLFISMGHDEYWSIGERDALEAARDNRVSLAFFAGNTGYWRIRYGASSTGVERRTITCYRDADLDPVHSAPDTTVQYRNPPFARPEQSLLGVMYQGISDIDAYPEVVHDPSHWIYEGTGVRAGDVLTNIVGNEWDAVAKGVPAPPNLEIVAHALGVSRYANSQASNATVYYPSASSLVFAAGTIQWAQGLGREGFFDTRIEHMTQNVLAHAGLPPLREIQGGAMAAPPPVAGMRVLAGSGEPGYQDGAPDVARFNAPVGLARAPNGTLYVADQGNHRLRAIAPDGTVSTVAGCEPNDAGEGSFSDGTGAEACFNIPTGVAIGPDGTIYVSDTGNHAIRAVTPGGLVSTLAGSASEPGNSDAANPLDARFKDPRGIAVGPDGAIYVADAGTESIRRIDSSGVSTVVTALARVSGLTVDAGGNLYAVSASKGAIYAVANGHAKALTAAGNGNQDGPADAALTRAEGGMIVDGNQLVFTDAGNYALRALGLSGDQSMVTLLGGNLASRGVLKLPRGIAWTPAGYAIADTGGHRVVVVPRELPEPPPAAAPNQISH